ncbi:MAG: non-ribosomal peptide synthetase [Candidatus Entotheonellia bacterium]
MEHSSGPGTDRRRQVPTPWSHIGTTAPFVPLTTAMLEQSIPARFEQQVEIYADRLAVKTRSDTLTYAALNHAANRIAHAILAQRGTGEEPIALLLEQGAQLIAAILGVLKAGKMYVSLDPSFPQAQLTYMLEDSQAALIVTNDRHLSQAKAWAQDARYVLNLDSLEGSVATENPGFLLSPDTLAYILYTSGSTGRSKGVLQTHRNILHKVMINANDYRFSSDDRLSLLYSCCYSASVRCLFGALLTGAALYPFDIKEEGLAPMADWLSREGITVYMSVPSVFRGFIATLTGDEQFPTLRLVYVSGEPLPVRDIELYQKHCPAPCVLVHAFSSNEAGTIRQNFITKDTQISGNVVPVGYPTQGKEVFLVDESGAEVGVHVIGEIVVKSRYLTPGYWRQPELTAQTFTPAPDGSGARLYRTGDLGRLHPDGCLEHLGRKDFQVKIRGYRVDVPEIEQALLSLETVREAAVVAREDQAGEPCLAAYVIPARHPAPTISALRGALQGKFPEYMIPSAFVLLEALPLSPNGKLDLRALPAPSTTRPDLEAPFVAPRTPLEQGVAQIWAETLGLEQVGINDQFLDLGGHSLLATQIASRVREMFQVDIPLQSLLEAATVADMAVLIAHCQADTLPQAELARLLAEVEELSAGAMQQRLTGGSQPNA